MGEGFMRAMVGERGWRRESIVANVPTIEHPTHQEIVVRPRGLDIDSDAESTGSTPVGLTVPREAPSPAPSALTVPGETSSPPRSAENQRNMPGQEERRRQLAGEGDVIMNAFVEGINSIVNAGTTAAATFALDHVIGPIGEVATYVGLASSMSITVLSLGAGIWRYSRPTSHSSHPPSPIFGGLVLSTTLLGGWSTGVMLYARSALRATRPPPPKTPPSKQG